MFPVTSEKLSFADISDYWSRHMRTAEPPELLALLEKHGGAVKFEAKREAHDFSFFNRCLVRWENGLTLESSSSQREISFQPKSPNWPTVAPISTCGLAYAYRHNA